MKKRLVIALKIVVPIAIILWLVSNIEPSQMEELRERPKDWWMLALAFVIAFAAVSLTFLRWFLLVRALQIPFRVQDAFRLGFLGYLLNFVSVGNVGGDLFKAVFIARERPQRRAEAVATVVVDRVIGLYALLLVTSLAIFLSNMENRTPALTAICNTTYIATGLGGVFVLMLLTPGFTRGSLSEFLVGLPRIGHTLEKLIDSVRMYRGRKLVMTLIFVISLLVHSLLAIAFHFIALAMFERVPPLQEHLIIVPLSNVAAALPFTPAGLGSFEFAMEELYKFVPHREHDVVGVLVALAYRLITIAIAAVGVVYYWTCRREVQEVLEEAEHLAE